MSSILCLWKYRNYLKDVADGVLDESPAYNSRQKRLHSVTSYGERAYVVTYLDGRCYLVTRITITEKYTNDPSYEYGEFGISGDYPESTRYEPGEIDVTETLRRLRFKTGKMIGSSSYPISLYLQTIRELTAEDELLIDACIP